MAEMGSNCKFKDLQQKLWQIGGKDNKKQKKMEAHLFQGRPPKFGFSCVQHF